MRRGQYDNNRDNKKDLFELVLEFIVIAKLERSE